MEGSPRGDVTLSREGPTCVIRLAREHKLNALSSHMEGALDRALGSAEAQDSRCIVIAGSDRAFSAGADLGELHDLSPAEIMRYYRSTGEVYERLAAMPQPTIAAVSGWCLGGGFELALACDFRVASRTATFGLPEVEIGIIPSSGGTLRLVRLVGPARAKELMLVRTRLSAGEAHGLGLVTEVVDGDPLPRALELAARIAELPALAASLAKHAADRMPEVSRDAGILLERLVYAALAQTDDAVRSTERFAD